MTHRSDWEWRQLDQDFERSLERRQRAKERLAEFRDHQLCSCGSGYAKTANYDGYGIFLTYTCPSCYNERMGKFRPDIMEHYDAQEPIDDETD